MLPSKTRAPRSKAARRSSRAKPLTTYQKKRDFTKTPEPHGRRKRTAANKERLFVVQKHAASHLHYDFRLELDGVLLSWSVPKGPSVRAGERRLAVRTEDHPLDYADFEGVIPQGQYGGGRVLVWDLGTWDVPDDADARRAFASGRLTFQLHGQKLRGRFHLVRSASGDSKRENWLLIKGRDAAARDTDVVVEQPRSVLSGRTIHQIKA